VHRLAAQSGQQVVVAGQVEVGAKTNEIPMITPLLDSVDLDRAVVTADALHTQRATADYVHGRGADFAFPVKDSQPGLFDALDALPWHDARSPTPPPAAVTAGSSPAPSRSCPRPATCRSRTPARHT
jgi:Transposase DDE domain